MAIMPHGAPNLKGCIKLFPSRSLGWDELSWSAMINAVILGLQHLRGTTDIVVTRHPPPSRVMLCALSSTNTQLAPHCVFNVSIVLN